MVNNCNCRRRIWAFFYRRVNVGVITSLLTALNTGHHAVMLPIATAADGHIRTLASQRKERRREGQA